MALIIVERGEQLFIVPSQQMTLTGCQQEMEAGSDQLERMDEFVFHSQYDHTNADMASTIHGVHVITWNKVHYSC